MKTATKFFSILVAAAFMLTPTQNAQAQDLIITGAYDGPLTGGTPKGVELYVKNSIADLSICGLGSANNGGGSDGQEFTFPADAATAGDFIYVASEATQFNAWFGFMPDYTTTAMSINGDDAIELFCNTTVVDVFGDINVDGTGQPWEYLDSWAYRVDATGPDGSTFVLANWTFGGPDVLDGETSNSTAASPVPVGTYSGTLAVELVSFEGLATEDGVNLRWQTASEQDNSGFNIEYKSSSGLWEFAGFVEGVGNSKTISNYSYDVNLSPGTYSFRLQQMDVDGSTTYSPEIEIEVVLETGYVLTSAYPNPFRDNATFSLAVASDQLVTVAVYDALGRQVELLHDGSMAANETKSFLISGADLPSGLYVVRATGERFVATRTASIVR